MIKRNPLLKRAGFICAFVYLNFLIKKPVPQGSLLCVRKTGFFSASGIIGQCNPVLHAFHTLECFIIIGFCFQRYGILISVFSQIGKNHHEVDISHVEGNMLKRLFQCGIVCIILNMDVIDPRIDIMQLLLE